MYRRLRNWWCNKYNRPHKDPTLSQYSMEELMYEFYDELHRDARSKEKVRENGDNIEDKKMQEDLDWAEQEELKELEELKQRQQEQAEKAPPSDAEFKPSDAEEKWMKDQLDKQMKAMKEMYGDDFGEDITSGD